MYAEKQLKLFLESREDLEPIVKSCVLMKIECFIILK